MINEGTTPAQKGKERQREISLSISTQSTPAPIIIETRPPDIEITLRNGEKARINVNN